MVIAKIALSCSHMPKSVVFHLRHTAHQELNTNADHLTSSEFYQSASDCTFEI